jgi:2-polyprenyl-3-methyl-5-hydroxy-6-metoxy-1,4-benzoquinol methylase
MDLREITANTNRHPWELSRTKCVFKLLSKYKIHDCVDIGSGDRYFAKKLLTFVSGKIYAVDTGYMQTEVIDSIYCMKDISELPDVTGDNGRGGCIIMMDVLEHIEYDVAFLDTVIKKLPDNGTLLVTVPAFQFLFSAHDTFLKHYRRYNRKQLLYVLKQANVIVERCHYFYTSLLLARLISRLAESAEIKKRHGGIGNWRFSKTHLITQIICNVLNIDFAICSFFARFHIYIPGLSLVAVCKKGCQ